MTTIIYPTPEMTAEEENKTLWDLLYRFQEDAAKSEKKLKAMTRAMEVIEDCLQTLHEEESSKIIINIINKAKE